MPTTRYAIRRHWSSGDIIKAFKRRSIRTLQDRRSDDANGWFNAAPPGISPHKKALVDAGYADVPVVSVSWGDAFDNPQPGFRVNWLKILPIALAAVFSAIVSPSSIIQRLHGKKKREQLHSGEITISTRPRQAIRQNKPSELLALTREAADRFTSITDVDKQVPKVGIVGEIFLKFHAFAQKNISSWLVDQHIEVVPPTLTEFFLQPFVNKQVNQDNYLEAKKIPDFVCIGFMPLYADRSKNTIVPHRISHYSSPFPIFSRHLVTVKRYYLFMHNSAKVGCYRPK